MLNQLHSLFGSFLWLHQRSFHRDQRAVVVSFSDLVALYISLVYLFYFINMILIFFCRNCTKKEDFINYERIIDRINN
jgi:hypothetical protein